MATNSVAGIAWRGSDAIRRRFPRLHQFIKKMSGAQRIYSSVIAPLVPAPPTRDVSEMLHQLRSAHLRTMPRIEGTMLSAGCAGTWYFNWIRDRAGHNGRHIGIEFYTPKPADLPDNVEWIANTVGNMSEVKNASCQLVFSGQNLEHLWPEEVIGFFLESNRVLEDGGWLVVDSPNRLVTTPLNWSHPEHTVELTPSEAKKLAELAGFKVSSVVGLWLCRDPGSGKVLQFAPDDTDEDWPMIERIVAAENDPSNSFIWWLMARKTGAPRPDLVSAEMNRIFSEAWPERKTRFLSVIGEKIVTAEKTVVRATRGQSGPLLFGPYMPLKAGKYLVEYAINVKDADRPEGAVVTCDVVGSGGREIASKSFSPADIQQNGGKVRLQFSLPELEFGIQLRCISLGTASIECVTPIALVEGGAGHAA